MSLVRRAHRLGCRSVAFTYNDPVIFHEYAVDVAQACRERGIKSVAVTAGYVCAEPRREFYRYMDAANVDLKAFTEDFYRRIAGGHLQPVLNTLTFLKHGTSVWFEVTNLLIPGKNDSEAEIEGMTQWIVENLGSDVPIHFTAFHPDWKMIDVPPTPPATLARARQTALRNGVRYAYTGNVRDVDGGSTVCHKCGQVRRWFNRTAETSSGRPRQRVVYPGFRREVSTRHLTTRLRSDVRTRRVGKRRWGFGRTSDRNLSMRAIT